VGGGHGVWGQSKRRERVDNWGKLSGVRC
jgi:hypothetical protein